MLKSLFLATMACGYGRYEIEQVDDKVDVPEEITGDGLADGDSNGDGLADVLQSFGFGYDGGNVYFVTFDNRGLPPDTSDLWLVGQGGRAYEPDAVNVWLDPWLPLVPYYGVGGGRTGWAFPVMRDALYEVVVVDVNSFQPDSLAGLGDPALGRTTYDDPQFLVTVIDGADCAQSTRYLWEVNNGFALPLSQGITPSDPNCL